MKYWIAKARPAGAGVDFLNQGTSANWRTAKMPADFQAGDRIFFWSGAPYLEVIGLGTVEEPVVREKQGNLSKFVVQFLTDKFQVPLSIAELRSNPFLVSASFLKAGPSGLLFPLSQEQAELLYSLIEKVNTLPSRIDWFADEPNAYAYSSPSSMEGAPKLVQHMIRERDRQLAAYKKASVAAGGLRLACEACGVAFVDLDVDYGIAACEVHHAIPISDRAAPTKTLLEDLHILCANCHRMIHRSDPMLSVKIMRVRLENVRKADDAQSTAR
ncbi:MAG: HNH endonuclease [Nitrospira sp.]